MVVGSALGWYLGRQVYRAHHDPELGGSGWGSEAPPPSFSEGALVREPGLALGPLRQLGLSGFRASGGLGAMCRREMLGQRPWTRKECARLLEEVDTLISGQMETMSSKIYRALRKEFLPERKSDEQWKQSESAAGFDLHPRHQYFRASTDRWLSIWGNAHQ